jgi:small GTP-binding protein
MYQRKVCVLGSFAVGKTSLTERFVRSIFSERYHTTVGVRIHKKELHVAEREIALIIWDLAGEDELVELRPSYLRGAAGYMLVADGTRPETLEQAVSLHKRVRETIGPVPFVLAVNKADLRNEWKIDDRALGDVVASSGWTALKTSAKTGDGINDAFRILAECIVQK